MPNDPEHKPLTTLHRIYHDDDETITLRDPTNRRSFINKSAYAKLHRTSSSGAKRHSVEGLRGRFETLTRQDSQNDVPRPESFTPASFGYPKSSKLKPPLIKPKPPPRKNVPKDVNSNLIKSTEEISIVLQPAPSQESVDKIANELSSFEMDNSKKKRSGSFMKLFRGSFFSKEKKKKDEERSKNLVFNDNIRNETSLENEKELDDQYAQMHINRFNSIRQSFNQDQIDNYVICEQKKKEVKKLSDNGDAESSKINRDTPPRAQETYQNIQVVNPKATNRLQEARKFEQQEKARRLEESSSLQEEKQNQKPREQANHLQKLNYYNHYDQLDEAYHPQRKQQEEIYLQKSNGQQNRFQKFYQDNSQERFRNKIYEENRYQKEAAATSPKQDSFQKLYENEQQIRSLQQVEEVNRLEKEVKSFQKDDQQKEEHNRLQKESFDELPRRDLKGQEKLHRNEQQEKIWDQLEEPSSYQNQEVILRKPNQEQIYIQRAQKQENYLQKLNQQEKQRNLTNQQNTNEQLNHLYQKQSQERLRNQLDEPNRLQNLQNQELVEKEEEKNQEMNLAKIREQKNSRSYLEEPKRLVPYSHNSFPNHLHRREEQTRSENLYETNPPLTQNDPDLQTIDRNLTRNYPDSKPPRPKLSLEKLKLPPNREIYEPQPRMKSPIPMNRISTDKLIATELLKRAPSPPKERITTSVQIHPQRVSTPVELRMSVSSKMSPKKEDVRKSVEEYYWKQLKKLKEEEDMRLYNMQMNGEEARLRRSRSLSPSQRARSLPRDPRNYELLRVAPQAIPENHALVTTQQVRSGGFVRASPQRRSVDSLQRPIFRRGSLTKQEIYESNQYKRVSFSNPQSEMPYGQMGMRRLSMDSVRRPVVIIPSAQMSPVLKQVTVRNKICDIYGQIHDTPQSGIMMGQMVRPPLPPRGYYGFVRNGRLTASAHDLERRQIIYDNYENRPLPPLPAPRYQQVSDTESSDASEIQRIMQKKKKRSFFGK